MKKIVVMKLYSKNWRIVRETTDDCVFKKARTLYNIFPSDFMQIQLNIKTSIEKEMC